MNILRSYFFEGHTIDQIVEENELSVADVRKAFCESGLSVSADETEGAISVAVKRLGYSSIAEFIRKNQLLSIRDQARILGVSRRALGNTYDVYRSIVTAQSS